MAVPDSSSSSSRSGIGIFFFLKRFRFRNHGSLWHRPPSAITKDSREGSISIVYTLQVEFFHFLFCRSSKWTILRKSSGSFYRASVQPGCCARTSRLSPPKSGVFAIKKSELRVLGRNSENSSRDKNFGVKKPSKKSVYKWRNRSTSEETTSSRPVSSLVDWFLTPWL